MNYHNITTNDMLNGAGLRTVLWTSGCNHHCKNCQNPQTWDENSGIPFGEEDLKELKEKLKPDYISGITFSGGDPMFPHNRETILSLCKMMKKEFPTKTIWMYSGYTWEQIKNKEIIQYIDVLVDGEFQEELKDISLPYCGSSNQRIIDVQATLKTGEIKLYC